MIQKSNKNNNLINILVYSLFKSFSLFINFFPRKFTILFGKFLGLIMFFTFSKNRKIAKKNLNIAFPDLSNSKINQLLKRVFQHYGIISIDFFRQKTINLKSVILSLDNGTQKTLSNKKGMILLASHFGNWEIFLPIISGIREICGIVRTQKNLGADKFISELRTFKNVSLIPNNSSLQDMLQPLLDDKILLILNDQKPKKSGNLINFFGSPALTPKGAGHFYLQSKCSLAFGYCILKKDYTYEFHVEEININSSLDSRDAIIKEINIQYLTLLEKIIKKHPEQYCWFYKKWDRSLYKNL